MIGVTTIVLTKNEEKNIEACIESAKLISERIIVVDCGSTDATTKLAKNAGSEVFFHEWQGHAAQFNWALDCCGINTDWVFRLDADERISESLAKEINRLLLADDKNVDGYEMRWRVYFMDKWLKHGGVYKPYFLRLFRYGKGRVENKLMDEHVVVDGEVKKLKNDLIHYDYKGLDALLTKHIWYSELEIRMKAESEKKANRAMYYRLPLFLRAKLYFWYRYFFQLGFLDGKEGKIYLFIQAYWFRFIVDAKLYEGLKNEKSAYSMR